MAQWTFGPRAHQNRKKVESPSAKKYFIFLVEVEAIAYLIRSFDFPSGMNCCVQTSDCDRTWWSGRMINNRFLWHTNKCVIIITTQSILCKLLISMRFRSIGTFPLREIDFRCAHLSYRILGLLRPSNRNGIAAQKQHITLIRRMN